MGPQVSGPVVLGPEHQALRRRVKRSSLETQVQVALPENQQSLICLRYIALAWLVGDRFRCWLNPDLG